MILWKSNIKNHNCKRGTISHFKNDQCIGISLEIYGEWAEEEISLLSKYISNNAIVIDVGANVGTHTIAFAQFAGVGGKVIAIEAQHETFAILKRNIRSNKLVNRVHTIRALAGNENADVFVGGKAPAENIGARSFVNDVANQSALKAEVKSIYLCRLKNLLGGYKNRVIPMISIDSLNLLRCDLIKIDVEGMEVDVIKGALVTIDKHSPVLYFEYAHDNNIELKKSHSILSELGYNMYWHISNPYNKFNFKGYKHNIFGGNTEINILATRDRIENHDSLIEIKNTNDLAPKPTLADALHGCTIAD